MGLLRCARNDRIVNCLRRVAKPNKVDCTVIATPTQEGEAILHHLTVPVYTNLNCNFINLNFANIIPGDIAGEAYRRCECL